MKVASATCLASILRTRAIRCSKQPRGLRRYKFAIAIQGPHPPAVNRPHNAWDKRTRTGSSRLCHAARDESALYVRLYRECHGTQCHAGGGGCPASKALFTLNSENQGEREALLRVPRAAFQSSGASEIPAAGRKRLAQWHYRKHQPFGNVVPGGGNDSTHRPARD